MPVKVEIKLDVESMVDYMIYQVYMSKVGIIAIILGVFNVVLAMACAMNKNFPYMVLFFAFGFVILGIFPMMIRRKIERKVQNSRRIGVPVTYEFSDEGVVTTTPDDSGKASWKVFKRAVSRKRIIILYDFHKQTIILPVDQIENEYTQIVDLIFKNMPTPAVRISRLDKKK